MYVRCFAVIWLLLAPHGYTTNCYCLLQAPEQHIPLRDLGSGYAAVEEHPPSYNDYKRSKPPVGGVPLFPNLEPVSRTDNE